MILETHEWRVAVGADETSAVYERAGGDTLFVCAHGAGGNMSDRGVLATAKAMLARGIDVVRFNFLYKEKKSGRPDPMPKLMDTITAVVGHARAEVKPKRLIIGGRSMGGRAASMLAADGFDAEGLFLLAYPLHPAGQPSKLRDAHLPRIAMRTLCVNGTRDALCTPELMNTALTTVTAPWKMHWIDGADHSFHMLKSSGRTDGLVMEEIGDVAAAWLSVSR